MKRALGRRVDKLGAVGQAAVDLARAEAATLRGEFRANARRLLGVVVLFAAALFTAFWALGTLVFSLVELTTRWLPPWGAALAVAALLLLAAVVLLLVARRRLRRLETPVATVQRRVEDYQRWWERRTGGPGAEGADEP